MLHPCDTIVQAPAPSRPIYHGLAGLGLLAHVLVSKYADHLPLYRQSEIYAREGVDLDRSTLSDFVGAASYLLSPLVDQLAEEKATNSAVEAFAERMVREHTQMADTMKPFCRVLGLTPPTGPDSDHQDEINKLNGLSGKDFDKEYGIYRSDGDRSF